MVDRLTPTPGNAVAAVGPGTATPGVPGAISLGRVELLLLPERLQSLSRPVVVTGQITGQAADGSVGLRTQFGEIRLSAGVPLPTDRPLTLQIGAGNPPRDAIAVTDSAPPTATGAPVPAASAAALKATIAATPSLAQVLTQPAERVSAAVNTPPAATPATNPASLPTVPLTVGTRVTALILTQELAVLVRPATLPAAAVEVTPPAAAPLPTPAAPGATPPAGGALLSALAQASGQASGAPAVAPTPTTAAPVPDPNPQRILVPGAPPPTASPAAAPTAAPQQTATPQTAAAQAPLPQAVVAVPASAQPAPTLAAPPLPALESGGRAVHLVVAAADAPDAVPAGVLGVTEDGLPLVKIGAQTAVLLSRAPVAAGQTIALATVPVAPQSLPPAALTLFQGRDWPALKESLAALDQADAAAAFRLRDVLPQKGPALLQQLGLFITAARAGKLSAWLGGDTVDAIERRAGEGAARQLIDDFARIGQQSQAPAADGWRTTTLPFLAEGQLQRLELHVKSDDGQEANNPRGRARRFVVDTELTALGPIQVDGLMQARSLDLILRSREPLTDDLKNELQIAHAAALAASGFTGVLTFQDGARAAWVKITPNR